MGRGSPRKELVNSISLKDKDVVIGPRKPKGLAKIHGSERGKEEGNGPRKPKAWNRLA